MEKSPPAGLKSCSQITVRREEQMCVKRNCPLSCPGGRVGFESRWAVTSGIAGPKDEGGSSALKRFLVSSITWVSEMHLE